MEKRTPAQWTEYLSLESTPVTITEYMAGCLSRLLGAQVAATQAAEHTEGMLGAMDEMFSRHDPGYAASGKVREALDAKRDADRALAERERHKQLPGEGT